jgi:integrase
MGRRKNTQPTYLEHKASGQARVRINGVDHYLGPHGSPESYNKYYELLAEKTAAPTQARQLRATGARLTIAELIEAYREYAKGYYGNKSKELGRIASAVRPLDTLFSATAVDDFSPLKLQRVLELLVLNGDTRAEIVKAGGRKISRTTVNDYLQVLKRLFRWGVSQELVRSDVHQAICTVDGVRRGRGELSKKTAEPKKVLPVDPEDVEKAIVHCQPEIAAMIRLQLLCGCRPDEVTIMRPCDIDQTTKPCWIYKPTTHKNEWRGQDKEILIGPKAKKLLLPWIKKCESVDGYLFSPRKVAERWNEEQIRLSGKKPAFVKLNVLKPPRECYDDHSYAQAVRRACRRAGIDEWTPGRLRHNAGTNIRAEYGAEAAKLVLGHKHLNTTEIYAEKDRAKYAKIMSKLG